MPKIPKVLALGFGLVGLVAVWGFTLYWTLVAWGVLDSPWPI